MLDGIVSVLVVLMIFAFIGSLLAAYIRLVDPYHFRVWKAALLGRRRAQEEPTA